jgi:DNA-directed RNA polymerase subunit RPC12/RpoP
MVRRRFHCLSCGHDFETEVFEPGEAEKKRLPASAVRCPRCNRTDLRRET